MRSNCHPHINYTTGNKTIVNKIDRYDSKGKQSEKHFERLHLLMVHKTQ